MNRRSHLALRTNGSGERSGGTNFSNAIAGACGADGRGMESRSNRGWASRINATIAAAAATPLAIHAFILRRGGGDIAAS